MTPAEAAAAVYEREPGPRTFTQDLEAHLIHGIVFSDATRFVMARYVSKSWPDEVIIDPWNNDQPGERDCIHIYLASGDFTEFFTILHKPATWISFERRGKPVRFHPYLTLLKRCTSMAPTLTRTFSAPPAN